MFASILLIALQETVAVQERLAVSIPEDLEYIDFEFIDSIPFAPRGHKTCYVAKRGKDQHVVIDGVEGEPFDDVGVPVFNSNGKRIAYSAKREGKTFFVLDD